MPNFSSRTSSGGIHAAVQSNRGRFSGLNSPAGSNGITPHCFWTNPRYPQAERVLRSLVLVAPGVAVSEVTFQAAVSGVATVAPAKLTLERKLAAAIAALATVTPARLTEEKKLAAAVAGAGAVATSLSVLGQVFLQAAVAGQAAVAAALKEDKRLQTLVAGGATIAAGVKLTELVQAVVSGQAQIVATLTVPGSGVAVAVKGVDQTVQIVMLSQ